MRSKAPVVVSIQFTSKSFIFSGNCRSFNSILIKIIYFLKDFAFGQMLPNSTDDDDDDDDIVPSVVRLFLFHTAATRDVYESGTRDLWQIPTGR